MKYLIRKKDFNRYFIVSLTIIIVFLFSFGFKATMIDNRYNTTFLDEKLIRIKSSGDWNLPGTTISIDNNWSSVKAAYDWCTGEGTQGNPYKIENVSINALDSGSCIEIQNSNDYFIIQNCSLHNAGSKDDAGITLYNVTNGEIINNEYFNNDFGISLKSSDANMISENIFYQNNNAIRLYYSDGNSFLFNSITYNEDCGLWSYDSHYNNISMNDVSFNGAGFTLHGNINNTISENTVNNNDGLGIMLDISINCTISRNTVNYNGNYGINILQCDDSTLLGNIAINNTYGINFGGKGNILSGNKANFNTNGMSIGGGDNIISKNIVNNNSMYGLEIGDDDNIISENTANNNKVGMSIGFGNNDTVSGNLMNFCGITLSGSLEDMASHSIDTTNLVNNKPIYYYINEIGLNISNFANVGQILLVNCTESIISNITLSHSSIGIFLGYCDGITISENTVNYNNYRGILIYESNHNNIIGNSIRDNFECGLYLYESEDNRIFFNYFINNGLHAKDDGNNNLWDNGVKGNYWDDYLGFDNNFDGIGDSAYLIPGSAGSYDHFPIWNKTSFGTYLYIGIFTTMFVVIVTSITIIIYKKIKKKSRP